MPRLDPKTLTPYHSVVAPRNNAKKNNGGGSGVGCLVLLAFLLLAIGLVLFNKDAVSRSFKGNRFIENVLKNDQPPGKAPEKKPPAAAPDKTVPEPSETPKTSPQVTAPVKKPEPEPAKKPTADTPPSVTKTAPPKDKTGTDKQGAEKPAGNSVATTKSAPAKTLPDKPNAVKAPVEKNKPDSRARSLWFVRIENDGVISRVKVKRTLPVTDTPLVDALAALMTGPDGDELKKGYSSLIPTGSKLLSATVRGSTAYLSFNEAFQFNSFGIEGYAAQLRQIVWTATEFESVKDVQILIEGRHMEYLGSDGIFVGSPLNRESL